MSFFPDSALVGEVRPSPNAEPRHGGRQPDLLLLHYTGMATAEAALARLTSPSARVSCHYVVLEEGTILQLVPEAQRAWHAGVSYWAGERDINSCSIGIEIVNPGHDGGYPPFPEAQMAAVTALGADIVARHGIAPRRVLAHSDVAPARKMDPGEKFDWAGLARAGVGAWVEPAPLDPQPVQAAELEALRAGLERWGYEVATEEVNAAVPVEIVAAFQRHYRPASVTGKADRSTVSTIMKLLRSFPA